MKRNTKNITRYGWRHLFFNRSAFGRLISPLLKRHRFLLMAITLLPALLFICGCSVLSSLDKSTDADNHHLCELGTFSIVPTGQDSHFHPGDTVSLVAQVKNNSCPVNDYTWTIVDPTEQPLSLPSNVNAEAEISFSVDQTGTYKISCTVAFEGTTQTQTQQASIFVENPDELRLTYKARIIPPPTSQYPAKEIEIQVGQTDQNELDWRLDDGYEITISVTNSQTPLSTYLRIIRSTDEDPLPTDIYLKDGHGTVKVNGLFSALLIPAGTAVAPELITNLQPSALSNPWPIELTPGKEIKGIVKGSQGEPLAEVTATFHSNIAESPIVVPSTLGVTNNHGAFALRTRAGQGILTIAPPSKMGLPFAIAEGVDLTPDSNNEWLFEYKTGGTVSLASLLKRFDDTPAAPGALVVFTLLNNPPIGTLHVGTKSYSAFGKYQYILTTNSQGIIHDPGDSNAEIILPQGKYQVDIWPGPKETPDQGYTQIPEIDLTPGLAKSIPFQFSRRVEVRGIVADENNTGVKAQIIASAPTGSFATTANQSGKFSLTVDNGANYNVIIRALPGAAKNLGRYIISQLSVSGDRDLKQIVLPPAVNLRGYIKTAGNLAIPNAVIRIWCSGQGCPSHELVDETQSYNDGSFELRIPKLERGE